MPQFVDMLTQVGYVIGHGGGEGLKGVINYNKIGEARIDQHLLHPGHSGEYSLLGPSTAPIPQCSCPIFQRFHERQTR